MGKWLHACQKQPKSTSFCVDQLLCSDTECSAGHAICTLLLLGMLGCVPHQVLAAENVSVTTTNDGQTPASCSTAVPRLLRQQSWESSRTTCATDITVVTHLYSSQYGIIHCPFSPCWLTLHWTRPTTVLLHNSLCVDRLSTLGHLCASWKGWVAAAVHVASDVNTTSLLSAMGHWHHGLDKLGMSIANA